MTIVLLCRHGRTDWNDLGRYQGQTDVPLNAQGREQARVLAAELRSEPLKAVYASDLSRAADTAAEIARLHGLEVRLDRRLREINQGDWEGLTVPEIRQVSPTLFEAWEGAPGRVRLPGGESLADVRDRAMQAVREMLGEFPEQSICLVTHKVVQCVIHSELTGRAVEEALGSTIENGSVERVLASAPANRRRRG